MGDTYRIIGRLELVPYPFDEDQAVLAAQFRPLTRDRGLGIGDRACLALARHLGLPVITRDRHWGGLQVGVDIRIAR